MDKIPALRYRTDRTFPYIESHAFTPEASHDPVILAQGAGSDDGESR